MIYLQDHEIKKHQSYEAYGYLFSHEGKLYRGIYPFQEEEVLHMFRCGLIDELIQEGLFPESSVADLRTSDCNLVIQHDKIPVVTLPIEWSFSMLKDAALVTLQVNIIAQKYGYQIKDAHGFNVVFQYGTPLFVDLGSFANIANDFNHDKPGWWAYGEFMRFFYAPLMLWSHGDSFFGRHALHGDQMPMVSYWRYRNPLLRLVPRSLLSQFEYYFYKYKALNTRSIDLFLMYASQSALRKNVAKFVLWLARNKMLWFSSVNLQELEQQIKKIRPPRTKTEWGSYQTEMEQTDRHRFIVQMIDKLGVKTVLDLGGNAGLLSRYILDSSNADYAVSTDYDELAIETLYLALQENSANIYPALLNFGISISDTKFAPVQERLRSEAVMALALTHHLILTQGMSLSFVFERIKSFSSKYVFIEFMPLGCYSSTKGEIPTVPDWYNVEWFRSAFEQHFIPIEERQIEANRVLFVGQLHGDL
jgi:hypothetical protein